MNFKLDKYKVGILLGIAVVALVALLDVKSATSGIFGTLADYTNGLYANGWWDLFKGIVLFTFALIPICYYFFVKKDVSESVAIFYTSYTMWMFGLADVLYFWIQGSSVPALLPWLDKSPIIGGVAGLFGSGAVTNVTLFISVILGFGAVWLISTLLEKINFSIGGVKV